MRDEWVPVEEDTPQISSSYAFLTDDVKLKFANGKTGTGYYDYRNCCWRKPDGIKYREYVVAWKSM